MCPTHKGFKISLHRGSFWEGTNLKLPTLVQVLYLWAFKIFINISNDLPEICEKITIQWFFFIFLRYL